MSEDKVVETLSTEELELLNSKIGMRTLFRNKKVNVGKVIERVRSELKLTDLQEELIKLQNWVINENKKVVIIFEGRDSAGKGGAIRRITEHINPRHFRTVALGIPTSDESQQWFFQRYVNQLPKPGEMVFFDRSWYNRAVVEPVNEFCTEKEYKRFMSQVNDFERMFIESDTYLIKLFFSISKEEQAKRFEEIKQNPLKRWKITPVDEKAQALWDVYTRYEKSMFDITSTELALWKVIDANRKTSARRESIEHILETLPYDS